MGGDDRLALGAGALRPRGRQVLAELLEAGGEIGRRRLHLHALGLELLDVPGRLLLGDLQPRASAAFAAASTASCWSFGSASKMPLFTNVTFFGIHAWQSYQWVSVSQALLS